MAQFGLKGNFEGYLWKSDEKMPEVYEGNRLLDAYTFDD